MSRMNRISSFILCFVIIISICGCKPKVKNAVSNSDSSDTSSVVTPSSDVSGNTDSKGTEPDESEESVSSADPLSGEITASGTVSHIRSDAFEVRPKLHGPNINNPATGFCDPLANKRRNEVLNSKNTENYYKITGTKYYLSTNGNDFNDGKSPETALRTIDGLERMTLNPGDAVLFERGSIFRFKRTINAKKGVIYGSYGKGDKPEIYASPNNFATESIWTPSKKANVWQTSFPYEAPGGLFINFGKIVGGMKITGLPSLEKNGDFYNDSVGGLVYLYCDKGNPSKVYKSIEISPSFNIFTITSGIEGVVIDNLCLKYSGAYAVSALGNAKNISITHCEIGYIGGKAGSSVRYGNSVEFWCGAVNVNVTDNWFYQVFDTAVSWQGNKAKKGFYDNIAFSNNLFEYNNADIEFFEGENADAKNFTMGNNICRFTSMGWGSDPIDSGIRGIEGVIRASTSKMISISNFKFINNTIDCPARQIINWDLEAEKRSDFKAYNNKVYIKSSYRTTNTIIQGFKQNEGDTAFHSATDISSLKNVFSIFDKSAKLYWK